MPSLQPPPFTLPLIDKSGQIPPPWQRWMLSATTAITSSTAPSDAQYWVSTVNSELSAERNLGTLTTGYLKVTVALGVATPSSTATIPATDLSGTIPDARFPATLPALNGSLLTALNATQLTTGTVPDARFPATLPALSGANLTALNATNLASGTVPDARFPATLPAVSGANLTALNGSNVASGTIALARGGTNADLSATGGASQVLKQTSAGAAVSVAQLASTDLSDVVSGAYVPTLTNVANLDASTAYSSQYVRIGSVVMVSGRVDVDPTAAVATQLGISLPIASNLANPNECAGTAFASGIAGQGAAIRGDAANDRAEMVWIAADLTNQPMFWSFCYRII
jgi:hypothetical protein